MAVALDVAGTDFLFNSVATISNNTSITVGSGSNRALFVVLCFNTATPTGITVTWDSGGTNQVMTQVPNSTAQNTTHSFSTIFWLPNPISGQKNLAVNWTTSAWGSVCA